MHHGIRSASDTDITLATYRADLNEIMADFRPPVDKVISILNNLEPFATTAERARSRTDLLAFFAEKSDEVDFAPGLDCRFPFFWGRFARVWMQDGTDEANHEATVVRLFPDDRIEHKQASW